MRIINISTGDIKPRETESLKKAIASELNQEDKPLEEIKKYIKDEETKQSNPDPT